MNIESREAARLSRRERLGRGGQALALSGLAAHAGGARAAASGQPDGPPAQTSRPGEASGMKVYFDNPLFDAQLLRALAHAYYGGADVGECLSTAQRIREGDFDSWYDEWAGTGDRLYAAPEASLDAGHPVSAREA